MPLHLAAVERIAFAPHLLGVEAPVPCREIALQAVGRGDALQFRLLLCRLLAAPACQTRINSAIAASGVFAMLSGEREIGIARIAEQRRLLVAQRQHAIDDRDDCRARRRRCGW